MTTFVPLARSKALTRAMLWGSVAVISGTVAALMLANIEWRPSPASSALVEYAIALVALPIGVTALITAGLSARWLLLTIWPAKLGLEAGPDHLVLRLGPFGTRWFDSARLNVRYPFQLSADVEDGRFGEYEAFLPEEVQRATLLPRIMHPDSEKPISPLILRYIGLPEAELAASLRPLLQHWQTVYTQHSDRSGD